MDGIEELAGISRLYGADARFVLLGGGNTSLKQGDVMYVKASGTQLGTITADGFVRMSLPALDSIWVKEYPQDEKEREAKVLADMMASRIEGETKRPSVEALLHAFLPFICVVHLHPALVNGMTCGQTGMQACRKLFPEAIWVPMVNPGFILANVVRKAYLKHHEDCGVHAKVIFLQNHGVFVAADGFDEVKSIYANIMDRLEKFIIRQPNLEPMKASGRRWDAAREAVSGYFGSDCIGLLNKELSNRIANQDAFESISSAFTPDHIVYSGFKPLWIPDSAVKLKAAGESIAAACRAYEAEYGARPKVVVVQGVGAFCDSDKSAALFIDTMKVAAYSETFGGPLFMEQDKIDFIRHWEVESYRAKVAR